MSALMAMEQAVFAALSAPGAVSAPVHQHAPQGTALPLVVIGDLDNAAPIGRAGDADLRAELAVMVLTNAEERAPCLALLAQVRSALDGKVLAATGWRIAPALSGVSAQLDEDGQGYTGLALFSVLALAD